MSPPTDWSAISFNSSAQTSAPQRLASRYSAPKLSLVPERPFDVRRRVRPARVGSRPRPQRLAAGEPFERGVGRRAVVGGRPARAGDDAGACYLAGTLPRQRLRRLFLASQWGVAFCLAVRNRSKAHLRSNQFAPTATETANYEARNALPCWAGHRIGSARRARRTLRAASREPSTPSRW